MPEVRSLCLIVAALLDADSVRWRPPFRPSRPPFRPRAKTGRLQPGMGGRLQTESVVAFERNGWSSWTGIRSLSRNGIFRLIGGVLTAGGLGSVYLMVRGVAKAYTALAGFERSTGLKSVLGNGLGLPLLGVLGSAGCRFGVEGLAKLLA